MNKVFFTLAISLRYFEVFPSRIRQATTLTRQSGKNIEIPIPKMNIKIESGINFEENEVPKIFVEV